MVKKIQLNNNWNYIPEFVEGMQSNPSVEGFLNVNLPHANKEIPFNYFDEKAFQIISCYKKAFVSPDFKQGQLVKVRFEGVMTFAKVYLDGTWLGEHKGGYTPFEFEIQQLLVSGKEHMLTVVVDSSEREDIPPFGGQIDYLTYGGIYREVSLEVYEAINIKNAHVMTVTPLEATKGLEINLHLDNRESKQEVEIIIELKSLKGELIYHQTLQQVIQGGEQVVPLSCQGIENIRLWDIEDPNLYEVGIKVIAGNKEDVFTTRIGFRKCEFKADGFYLNEQKRQIVGVNRHQAFPYVGYAMPKRVQEKDADILKNELHVNLVRTSHYPQSIHFLNRCDEIGLLVFEEIPGWQHIGDEAWKQVAITNVEEMIKRDWNHPSIILWGIRINESHDDSYFYERTNHLARGLDPTRQTGGVRCIPNSQFLEDVYTMNDFIHSGGEIVLRDQKEVTGLDHDVPYMITEYNGHMFPTKKFDCEERQMEHVLRHLKVQNAAFADEQISGAIAWCAFDYNTHSDFGAGDRICYHGVMDMFRLPKFAASVYRSQISPEIEPVLTPVTLWASGERSGGGIIPIIILSNCDEIEFQYGDYTAIRISQTTETLSSLEYPPFIIDDQMIPPSKMGEWGLKWENAIFKGFVNGKEVIKKSFSKNPVPTQLSFELDDLELSATEKDATRGVIMVLDQCGQPLVYYDAILKITLTGPARLLGPSELVVKGGAVGFWIETCCEKGEVSIQASVDGLESVIKNLRIK